MKILITGSNGQLGKELSNLLDQRKIKYFATTSKDLDITNKELVDRYFEKIRPEVVYHCAAYTAVDNAEDICKKQNYDVNVNGTQNIAKACRKYQAILVYISTDYVFDGNNHNKEYLVDDCKSPKNEYGKAKLLGEQEVISNCTKYYVVRTSWVFGKYGKNFVYTMLNLAKTHKEISVVSDQIGRPTWAKTLAEFITFLVDNKLNYGIYHCSNDGIASWYEFAKEILKNNFVNIIPVSSKEYPTKAYRPRYSVMHLSKETGFTFISWKEALKEFLKEIEK